MSDEGLIIQIVFIFVFFITSFLLGLLPFKWQWLKADQTWGVLANCFAGGIFLSIALIHMLPTAAHSFHEGCGDHCDYEWAYLIVLLGYCLILFVERVVVDPHGMHGHEPSNTGGSQGQIELNADAQPVGETPAQNEGAKDEDNLNAQPAANDQETAAANYSDYSPYLLLASLSIHSVFEGIAIGLGHGVGELLNLVFAILVHKMVASVALGVSLSKMEDMTIRKVAALLSIFSAATPLGIIIGIGIASTANPYVTGTFLALSVGTFLYIAASEVIVDEFAKKQLRYAKYGAFMTGVVVIALLNLWGHDHEH